MGFSRQKNNSFLISIYHNPENYPPTLNAIHELSLLYSTIIIVCRNIGEFEWEYPSNCIIYKINKKLSHQQAYKQGVLQKVACFVNFIFSNIKFIIKYKPKWVLAYDSFAFLSIIVAKKMGLKFKFWYHNHDVGNKSGLKKLSIGRTAYVNEQKNLKGTDLFTLPAEIRKSFFNFSNFSGLYKLLPNYPSLAFYSNLSKIKNLGPGPLKLLYQGKISEGHGIKELIKFIVHINTDLELHLIGPADKIFEEEIRTLISQNGLYEKIFIYPPISYTKLPEFSSRFDVGLAISEPINLQYATAGTASNKIYEYMALGMPVVLYENKHYREILSKYSWAVYTDLSDHSLKQLFNDIRANYSVYSTGAYKSFHEEVNFENNFKELIPILLYD